MACMDGDASAQVRKLVTGINKNIMLLWSGKSNRRHQFPTSRQQIKKKKQKLLDYNKKFEPLKHPPTSKRNTTAVSSSPSRLMLSSDTESRLKMSRETVSTLLSSRRPPSMQTVRCHDLSSSPLSVIRTRNQCLHQQCQNQSSPPLRRDFLRKGSAVDQKIIRNILISKLNTSPSRTTASYSDAVQDKGRMQLSREIPLGLSDVVGREQMLRMSHILLGTEAKIASLNQMILSALIQRKREKMRATTEEEDSIMLRSIQRW